MSEIVRTSDRNGAVVVPLVKRNQVIKSQTEKELDQLNALWTAIEEKVLSMQPPRHIEFAYDEAADDHYTFAYSYCLGLQRHGMKWRICYGVRDDITGEPVTWRPITDCSTEIRVEAATHIDRFMEEVVKSAEEYLPKIRTAIQGLENALADI